MSSQEALAGRGLQLGQVGFQKRFHQEIFALEWEHSKDLEALYERHQENRDETAKVCKALHTSQTSKPASALLHLS
ncbi:hypothetical protein GLOTRDRAFT_132430 [Gloeophyllum trabeum ATCC 11539]|uniref:Uncharacterized protein n=1 Tax=Gloeophyllum trabeum (strain ATCC 11539 / FP-39264 / Madison 617) TaxID=670483 RepID=S7RI74_GLOTA|nr:uncharacterized protein GLOTRDRAFT_132430 [Gloeophyllum trabeum ATCC 11539]EPQ52314.1 hypothetical protein GLOTRDRAFT_132430 [Gloeophyllum trabeum ATCC 11539]